MAPAIAKIGETTAKPVANGPVSVGGRAYVTFLAGNGCDRVSKRFEGRSSRRIRWWRRFCRRPGGAPLHIEAQGCIVREIEPAFTHRTTKLNFAMAYYVINSLQASNLGVCGIQEDDVPGRLHIYEDLLKTLQITPPTPFAEQDFLNMYFKNIYRPIPLVYNLVLAMLVRHPQNVELDKVKVVHYCAAVRIKAMEVHRERREHAKEDINFQKKWWDIYKDESLDYKRPVGTNQVIGAAGAVNQLQPLIAAAMSQAGVVKYVTAPSAA
ncbi:glycogenin [Datura stramonium]|uniref:Hexosyltransferase n=1 Tax=Datura stramonium TaxID=4076 RepID=A0ABS8SZ86_DATST|nr:glycogenin [Datura stramonium]